MRTEGKNSTNGARDEERSGHGDDGGGGLGSVVGLGSGGVSVDVSDEGVVSGLNGEDGSGGGNEGGGVDGTGGSEVSGHSNTLENLGETEESGNVRVGEGVVASLDRGGSSSSEGN